MRHRVNRCLRPAAPQSSYGALSIVIPRPVAEAQVVVLAAITCIATASVTAPARIAFIVIQSIIRCLVVILGVGFRLSRLNGVIERNSL